MWYNISVIFTLNGGLQMYYDFTVPIPEVKGKITLMRKGKLTYVQLETGRV